MIEEWSFEWSFESFKFYKRIAVNNSQKRKKEKKIFPLDSFLFSFFAKINMARDWSKERRERQEQYLRRQKLRSCPLVRATILGTQGTVYRVSSLVGHTRILRSTPCCLRTVVPFRGTPIVRRPSCLPETSLASRPSPRPSPIFSRSRRPPLNASWGFRDGNTFTRFHSWNGQFDR